MKATKPILALLAVLVVPVAPAAADASDLHRDVLEMLEADLSEEVVLEWLQGVEPPVRRPTAEELVALKKAGGTDRLLKALIALSSAAEGPGDDALATTPPSTAATAAPVMPVAEESAEAEATGVLVTFRLSYEAPKVDFDEELWDLYVYLDGEPLAYVPPSFSILDREKALEFKQRLTPGSHAVRVLQERHERRRGKRWRHAARASDQEFAFDLRTGISADIDLKYREGWLSEHSDGPLRFRLVQEDEVTELEWVGGSPERWPLLCEELEAEGRARDKLEGCVSWPELWGESEVPSRKAVRDALELFDYRPVPRGS